MNSKHYNLSRRYQAALRTHLQPGEKAGLELAGQLGREAFSAGVPTLELAKLHEKTLVAEMLPDCPASQRATLIKQAGIFFAAAITPSGHTHINPVEAATHLKNLIQALGERTMELAASNHDLSLEIIQRRAAEAALKKSERHSSQLLRQSQGQQVQMRRLSRQILVAHEDERKKISRELHDVIAQALTSINVRLATLKDEASVSTRGLDRNIARTQKLVEKSVNIVHRFARELRPAVLDDLGLIPALHSFMRNFTSRTGIRTRLTAFAGVEHLNTVRRTVLFRVAQEALTNVARHSQAGHAEITIHKLPGSICMKIKDDGISFKVDRVMKSAESKHLGLLGMRERLEMVGGRLNIESEPEKGTIIEANIPPSNASAKVSAGTPLQAPPGIPARVKKPVKKSKLQRL